MSDEVKEVDFFFLIIENFGILPAFGG